MRAYGKAYYRRRAGYYLERKRVNWPKYLRRNRAFVVAFLREHPCIDCGEADVRVLEFDHVKGEKVEAISELVHKGTSIKNLEMEIAKCVVRCANCHHRKTARDFSWHSLDGEPLVDRKGAAARGQEQMVLLPELQAVAWRGDCSSAG